MKIFIVEDDKEIANQLKQYLEEENFIVSIEHDGEEANFIASEHDFDAILLDAGLPGMDGFKIVENLRKAGKKTPVIMLTARDHKQDIIRGLDAGADDYIVKPFDIDEVIARVKAQIRRNSGQIENILSYKDISLDINNKRILKNDKYVKLTATEFQIIRYLFVNQGKIIGVNKLCEHVYEDFDNDSPVIAKHIANIRKKLGSNIIVTESGRGYYVPNKQG